MPISQKLLDKIRKDTEQAQARTGFAQRWDLGGKNSCVKQGQKLAIRIFQRWESPKDDEGNWSPWIYAEYGDHWWDSDQGKAQFEPCPRLILKRRCPICEAIEDAQSGTAAQREAAKRWAAQEKYVFNAIIGPRGNRVLRTDGLVDIRPILVPTTIFIPIAMTIAPQPDTPPEFEREHVLFDPQYGYDILLHRPPPDAKGERWKAEIAMKSAPAWGDNETEAFADWENRLHDLDAFVTKDLKSYAAIWERFYGVPFEGVDPDAEPEPPVAAEPPVAPVTWKSPVQVMEPEFPEAMTGTAGAKTMLPPGIKGKSPSARPTPPKSAVK